MKKKILFIMHMPPPVHGAAMVGQYIHDSKFVNQSFDCRYINLTTAQTLQDIGKGSFRKIGKFLLMLWRIAYTIVTFRPHLVYVTPNARPNAFYKDFIVVQTVKMLGCRTLLHFHNKGVSTRQHKTIDNILYKIFFHNTKVILLSEALYPDIKKYVQRRQVYICPNGIPAPQHHHATAQRQGTPQLLFLSNLLIDKGVLVLLDALAVLKERVCNFTCHFVGGETKEIDAARFHNEIQNRNLAHCVLYHGRKYGKDKEPFLRNAHVLVFPTSYRNECFPLVLLEAMMCKTPVISTAEGGIRDIVHHSVNGLIVEKNNPQSLAQAIETILEDEDRRREMGEAAFCTYQSAFTLEVFEQNFCHILQDIV